MARYNFDLLKMGCSSSRTNNPDQVIFLGSSLSRQKSAHDFPQDAKITKPETNKDELRLEDISFQGELPA
ncbi:unnamed protein product [Blepharisma stoltei]|uniref:Uncharacterized protein n=1 Tax=Blepharisma stoltei TaxID=1481888 RepID=A0AAU9K1V8_9CILI|nr:unnamed protein product [Blepharisma stoltei]